MESATPDNTLQYQLTREEVIAQLWRLMLRPRLIVSMALILLFGVGMLALRPERPFGVRDDYFPPCVPGVCPRFLIIAYD